MSAEETDQPHSETLRDTTAVSSEAAIAGDRGIPSVNRAASIQSRVSNLLAFGLMALVGGGLLIWYYTHAFTRDARVQQQAKLSAEKKADAEVTLRPLGRVDPPVITPHQASPSNGEETSVLAEWMGEPPPLPPQDARTVIQEEPAGGIAGASNQKDQPHARKLAGAVFIPARQAGAAGAGAGTPIYMSEGAGDGVGASGSPGTGGPSEARRTGELADLLRPTVTPAALASVLPTQRLLLAKGSFLDCTLETAIDSTLPGMTTCITATDTFSADGAVVLLERGTKLVGETRGSARRGGSRVFVLWTEARTRDGVVVPLASPGTDELGRAGVTGEIDRHFFERFGAAILISVIDGAVQSAVQSSDDATIIYNPSSSQNILTEVLRGTIDIPPTIRKAQGERIQVLVARDLDFRSVYELRDASSER